MKSPWAIPNDPRITQRPECPECDDCDCYGDDDLADDAYEIADPKHPRHYETMVDAADMRDGTEGEAA